MNNRQRGDYFERQTRAALEAVGWFVIRSGGSLGVADLVALRAGNTPLLVSCKLGGRIDPHERNALLDMAEVAGARAVVAMRSRPGHVLIAATHRAVARLVPVDTLKVPPRGRRVPRWATDADVPLPEPETAPEGVPDGLLPHGVQLTID